MSRRAANWLAWSIFAVSSAANLTGTALLAVVPAEVLDAIGDSLLLSGSFALVLVVFGLVGAIVAARLPTNPVGWLLMMLYALQGTTQLAYGAAHYSLSVEHLPGEAWFAWFASWSSVLPPTVLAMLMLVYPNGRLVSKTWRWAAPACVAANVPVVAQGALVRGHLDDFPTVRNPAGQAAFDWLGGIPTAPAILVILLIGTSSVVVRFRPSHGVERAQLKWFVWSAATTTAYLPVSFAVGTLTRIEERSAGGEVFGLIFAVLLCGLPVSIGIAMLRHRLYDIDLVINRTLVYGALTATLVATYLGSVLVFRLALDPLTGGSDLAVAASTLAVAALFRPLRAQIQAIVDRRFYRSRYDAARTLDGFAGRLRDELDVEALGVDLRRVVHDTMQPAHVSLWLRDTP